MMIWHGIGIYYYALIHKCTNCFIRLKMYFNNYFKLCVIYYTYIIKIIIIDNRITGSKRLLKLLKSAVDR